MNYDITDELFRAIDEIVKKRINDLKQEIAQTYQPMRIQDATDQFTQNTVEGALAELSRRIEND